MTEILMPQPIEAGSPTGHFTENHGPDQLSHIPDAVTAIGDTIAKFAAADANIRITMLGMLGQDIETAEAVISELPRDRQSDVLLDLVVSISGRDDMRDAVGVYKKARALVAMFRNGFAHGVWTYRSDFPDRLILIRADHYRKAHSRMFQSMHAGELGLNTYQPKRQEAWSAEDFIRAQTASSGLHFGSLALSVCFGRSPEEGAWLRDKLAVQGLLPASPWDLAAGRSPQAPRA